MRTVREAVAVVRSAAQLAPTRSHRSGESDSARLVSVGCRSTPGGAPGVQPQFGWNRRVP